MNGAFDEAFRRPQIPAAGSRGIAHHDDAAVYEARHPETVHFPVSDHAGTLSGVSLTAGVLEFVGGILLVLGLFNKPVAFLLSGQMAIAYFMAHMPRDFFPVNNGGDAAISFCFIFLYLVFAGPGALALDNRRST